MHRVPTNQFTIKFLINTSHTIIRLVSLSGPCLIHSLPLPPQKIIFTKFLDLPMNYTWTRNCGRNFILSVVAGLRPSTSKLTTPSLVSTIFYSSSNFFNVNAGWHRFLLCFIIFIMTIITIISMKNRFFFMYFTCPVLSWKVCWALSMIVIIWTQLKFMSPTGLL